MNPPPQNTNEEEPMEVDDSFVCSTDSLDALTQNTQYMVLNGLTNNSCERKNPSPVLPNVANLNSTTIICNSDKQSLNTTMDISTIISSDNVDLNETVDMPMNRTINSHDNTAVICLDSFNDTAVIGLDSSSTSKDDSFDAINCTEYENRLLNDTVDDIAIMNTNHKADVTINVVPNKDIAKIDELKQSIENNNLTVVDKIQTVITTDKLEPVTPQIVSNNDDLKPIESDVSSSEIPQEIVLSLDETVIVSTEESKPSTATEQIEDSKPSIDSCNLLDTTVVERGANEIVESIVGKNLLDITVVGEGVNEIVLATEEVESKPSLLDITVVNEGANEIALVTEKVETKPSLLDITIVNEGANEIALATEKVETKPSLLDVTVIEEGDNETILNETVMIFTENDESKLLPSSNALLDITVVEKDVHEINEESKSSTDNNFLDMTVVKEGVNIQNATFEENKLDISEIVNADTSQDICASLDETQIVPLINSLDNTAEEEQTESVQENSKAVVTMFDDTLQHTEVEAVIMAESKQVVLEKPVEENFKAVVTMFDDTLQNAEETKSVIMSENKQEVSKPEMCVLEKEAKVEEVQTESIQENFKTDDTLQQTEETNAVIKPESKPKEVSKPEMCVLSKEPSIEKSDEISTAEICLLNKSQPITVDKSDEMEIDETCNNDMNLLNNTLEPDDFEDALETPDEEMKQKLQNTISSKKSSEIKITLSPIACSKMEQESSNDLNRSRRRSGENKTETKNKLDRSPLKNLNMPEAKVRKNEENALPDVVTTLEDKMNKANIKIHPADTQNLDLTVRKIPMKESLASNDNVVKDKRIASVKDDVLMKLDLSYFSDSPAKETNQRRDTIFRLFDPLYSENSSNDTTLLENSPKIQQRQPELKKADPIKDSNESSNQLFLQGIPEQFVLKMEDLKDEKMKLEQQLNELKLELNQLQQERATIELELHQKDEVILKMQGEAQKRESNYKQDIKHLHDKLNTINEQNNNEEVKTLKEENDNLVKRETQLIEKINKLQEQVDSFKKVMSDYEVTLGNKVAESEKCVIEYETTKQHLAALEMAFSDIHTKYERSKGIIAGYKNNEETLLGSLKESNEVARKYEERYDSLKAHAKAQLDKANKDIIAVKEKHHSELSKLTTIIKRLEIKNGSIQQALDQKIKECFALSALCDEVTGAGK